MNAAFFKSWISYFVVAIAILATASPAKAGLIIAGTDQDHLNMAADPMFQSVGSVTGYNGTVGNVAGSGVLIGQQWFLTAGHVVTGYDALQVSFANSTFSLAPDSIDVDAVYSRYDGTPLFGDDIALLHLAEPVLGITPATLSVGGLQVGVDAMWAGYGYVAEYPGGDEPYDGNKRAGEQVIDRIGNGVSFGTQYFRANFGPVLGGSYSALEMALRPRDSGSPWFINENGQMVVAGIGTYGDLAENSFGVRTNYYGDWFSNVMTPVPEPSSCLLFSTASLLLGLRRSRRAAKK